MPRALVLAQLALVLLLSNLELGVDCSSSSTPAPPPAPNRSDSSELSQRNVKSQLKSALKSMGKKCLMTGKGRPLLEAVPLSEFSLSPLIVESSAFDVNISQVTVKNLNRFVVTEIERIFSDDRSADVSEKGTWFRVSVKVPLVAVSGHFRARGFVAQLFPVDGSGRLQAYYKQVTMVAKIGIIEPGAMSNVSHITLVDAEKPENSMEAEDVTFEEVALSVTQIRDDSIESLDGVGGDKESRPFQIGSVFFWKVARETSKELQKLLPECLERRFKETALESPSSSSRSRRRQRRRL